MWGTCLMSLISKRFPASSIPISQGDSSGMSNVSEVMIPG